MKKLYEKILNIFNRSGTASRPEENSSLSNEKKRLRFRYLVICLLSNILILASGFATKNQSPQGHQVRAGYTIVELPLKSHLPFTPGIKATLVGKNNHIVINEAVLLEAKALSGSSFSDATDTLYVIEIAENDLGNLLRVEPGELIAYPFVENNKSRTKSPSRSNAYEIIL
jgi:hypothetical protein